MLYEFKFMVWREEEFRNHEDHTKGISVGNSVAGTGTVLIPNTTDYN